MAIADEIQRIKTNIANAYTELENKGATIPETKNSENLASTIATVSSGGGDLDEYYTGTINVGTSTGSGILKSIKKLPALTPVGTSLNYAFYRCSVLTTLPNIDYSKVLTFRYAFQYCSKLNNVKIGVCQPTDIGYAFSYDTGLINLDLSNVDGSKIVAFTDMIYGCSNIENYIPPTNIGKGFTQKSNNYNNYTQNYSNCTKLTHDSLMNIINGLYDLNLTYNVAGGGTLYTQKLTLGSTNLAKLTADEIAIATNKGWAVS